MRNVKMTSCKCGHDDTVHYPLHWYMTGCKVEGCPCLDFET